MAITSHIEDASQIQFEIYVVGCGGIGGFLLNLLPQTMACIAMDRLHARLTRVEGKEVADRRISAILATEGLFNETNEGLTTSRAMNADATAFKAFFKSLTLIDGDSFSGHNALRQAAVTGSKLEIQLSKIRNQDAFTTWLHDCTLQGYNIFLNPSNIFNVFEIPKIEEKKWHQTQKRRKHVIFLCVDNHKTRYEVTRFAEENLHNCIIINGGNNKTTGNVTVYEKRDGVALDPPIYKIYPEVTADADRRPDEVGCGNVTLHNDQTAITNNIIASLMLNIFRIRLVEGNLERKTVRRDPVTKKNITARTNEVIVDLDAFTMHPLERAKSLDNRNLSTIKAEGQIEQEQIM